MYWVEKNGVPSFSQQFLYEQASTSARHLPTSGQPFAT